MLITFGGKRIIVAGAARGIGHGIAVAFAENGGTVIACDRLADEVEKFAGPAKSGGGTIRAAKVDVTDKASVDAVVASAGGPIDVLVYVAGGIRGQKPKPLEEVPVEDFHQIVDANLTGAFLFAQAVTPGMKRAGKGRIVTISSRAALAPSLTGIQAYASAKHGQLGLVRQLAHELGQFGITVNTVAPGFLRTSPDYEPQWDGWGTEGQKAFVERIAMRRMGTPDDIAHAVMFLASDYASWITGQILAGDGIAELTGLELPMNEQTPLEPWQWPEEHWRKLVNQVRAGRALRPKTWKNGARCAFAISFDSDHETNELREGGKSIGRMAWGQYGNRVGVPRILKMLKKHDIPGTFYVPAVAALLHPDEQRQVIAEGHEIGIHSWIHELNSVLPYEAEKDIMFRARDTLEKITGVRPVGARTASWDFSPHTLRITKEMGLLYDSSLMADEDCYELVLDGEPTGVVELPVEWVRDDAVYFMMHRFQSLRPQMPPEAVFDVFRREFDGAYEDGGICQITTHPHIIGYRSRIWIIEELIRHAKSKGDVWFATHAQVAAYAKDNAA